MRRTTTALGLTAAMLLAMGCDIPRIRAPDLLKVRAQQRQAQQEPAKQEPQRVELPGPYATTLKGAFEGAYNEKDNSFYGTLVDARGREHNVRIPVSERFAPDYLRSLEDCTTQLLADNDEMCLVTATVVGDRGEDARVVSNLYDVRLVENEKAAAPVATAPAQAPDSVRVRGTIYDVDQKNRHEADISYILESVDPAVPGMVPGQRYGFTVWKDTQYGKGVERDLLVGCDGRKVRCAFTGDLALSGTGYDVAGRVDSAKKLK